MNKRCPAALISGCIFFQAHPADQAPWATRNVAARDGALMEATTVEAATLMPLLSRLVDVSWRIYLFSWHSSDDQPDGNSIRPLCHRVNGCDDGFAGDARQISIFVQGVCRAFPCTDRAPSRSRVLLAILRGILAAVHFFKPGVCRSRRLDESCRHLVDVYLLVGPTPAKVSRAPERLNRASSW